MGGHPVPGPPVHHDGLGGTEPAGGGTGAGSGSAAAVLDGHLAADRARGHRLAGLGLEDGDNPDSAASLATRIVSAGELPQPGGQGTRMCR
jgi:hypothetical protein